MPAADAVSAALVLARGCCPAPTTTADPLGPAPTFGEDMAQLVGVGLVVFVVLPVASLLLFGLTAWLLSRRDKRIEAQAETADALDRMRFERWVHNWTRYGPPHLHPFGLGLTMSEALHNLRGSLHPGDTRLPDGSPAWEAPEDVEAWPAPPGGPIHEPSADERGGR